MNHTYTYAFMSLRYCNGVTSRFDAASLSGTMNLPSLISTMAGPLGILKRTLIN